ncbi:MAG: mechanosensitive ion channel family protein [Rhodospirillales bacterium]|nr:mechanosensitive ion channel family protein [Rhodospirillales bacterium]
MADPVQAAAPQTGMGMHGALPDMVNGLGASAQAVLDAGVEMLRDAATATGRFGQAARLFAGEVPLGTAFAWAAATLAAALLVAALVRLVLSRSRARLAAARPEAPGETANLLLRGLLLDLAPAAAYLLTGLLLERVLFAGPALAFPAGEIFRMVLSAVIVNSAVAWFVLVLVELPVAVRRPALRLFPFDGAAARRGRDAMRRVVVLGIVAWLLAECLYLAWIGSGLPRLILIVAAVAIAVMCLRILWRVAPYFHGFGKIWHRLAVISVFGILLTWVHGLLLLSQPPFGRVLGTLAILGAMPLIDELGQLVLRRIRRHLAAYRAASRTIYVPSSVGEDDIEALRAVEQPLDGAEAAVAATEIEGALDACIGVIHDAFYLVLAVVAAILLAKTWSLNLVGMLAQGDVRTWLGALVDAGATLVVGWYAWRLFETGLALRLSREDGGLQSRARTVQPLLRGVGKLVIGSVAVMGALSELGLNIAPLLASAGVVGIAVGFGAQTLVKDLFSGASFLIEDVFRIGDYIEAGTAKGTVEKITFRTVALRHQNGPLHFVPYGSLGSVRNNSRDWVIDKFEIPLPIGVSSETIRKMVKKIGQEMLADEKLAQIITEPLKAKLYRIQPGAKIFRCKVQTPPGMQFEVRTDAYRRIEIALAAAGIAFADTTPQVTVNNTLPPGEPVPASPQAAARAAE